MNCQKVLTLSLLMLAAPIFAISQAEKHEFIYKEFIHVKNPSETGYHIISAAEIEGKEKKGHQEYQSERKEMQVNGYAYSDIYDFQGIFSIQYTSRSEYPFLKSRVSEIELAFPYNGLYFVDEKNNLGYYFLWMYQDGWLGVGQYFRDNDLGICNYERLNVGLGYVSVRLVADDLSYEINNKPTQYIVRGSDKVGYFTSIDWYDVSYQHNLSCGSKKLKPSHITQMIALAVKIDHVK